MIEPKSARLSELEGLKTWKLMKTQQKTQQNTSVAEQKSQEIEARFELQPDLITYSTLIKGEEGWWLCG